MSSLSGIVTSGVALRLYVYHRLTVFLSLDMLQLYGLPRRSRAGVMEVGIEPLPATDALRVVLHVPEVRRSC